MTTRRSALLATTVLATTVLAAGCSSQGSATTSAAGPLPTGASGPPGAAPGPTPAPAADGDAVVQRSRPLMGTIYTLTAAGVAEEVADPPLRAALDEIARLEELLSEWRSSSEVSRVNDAAGSAPVVVSPDTLAVVRAGLEVSAWSDGAFDLTWAALRGVYDFRPGRERHPEPAELRALLPLVDWRRVLVDEATSAVAITRRGMAIGTGGIGKGYALDRAAAILDRAGLAHYMLFAGGQVQVRGRRGPRPWRVGIQHPRLPEPFAFVEAESGSVSTSGDYEHAFVDRSGKRWHHIVDPDRGLPVEHTVSATVVAARGVHADALSTACFVLGADRCFAMLEHVPGETLAVVVDRELRVHLSPGAAARVRWTRPLDPGGQLPLTPAPAPAPVP